MNTWREAFTHSQSLSGLFCYRNYDNENDSATLTGKLWGGWDKPIKAGKSAVTAVKTVHSEM